MKKLQDQILEKETAIKELNKQNEELRMHNQKLYSSQVVARVEPEATIKQEEAPIEWKEISGIWRQ